MKWEDPPILKIYEALGAIADKRVHLHSNEAEVYSSSGNKFYKITYNPKTNEITSSDNGSYWMGYLGYPSITFLMLKGVISYDAGLPPLLKEIPWKDINVKFNNDFEKTEKYIRRGIARKTKTYFGWFDKELDKIMNTIKKLQLNKMETDLTPPMEY
jgi:hypothetical protein